MKRQKAEHAVDPALERLDAQERLLEPRLVDAVERRREARVRLPQPAVERLDARRDRGDPPFDGAHAPDGLLGDLAHPREGLGGVACPAHLVGRLPSARDLRGKVSEGLGQSLHAREVVHARRQELRRLLQVAHRALVSARRLDKPRRLGGEPRRGAFRLRHRPLPSRTLSLNKLPHGRAPRSAPRQPSTRSATSRENSSRSSALWPIYQSSSPS